MAIIRDVLPVKPVCAVTFAPNTVLSEVIEKLEELLGPVEDRTEVFKFSFTGYYSNEMGQDLKKIFMSFKELVHPSRLAELKNASNVLEKTWQSGDNRSVNIDPGYVTAAKLVVASAKDFAHRIFIGDGIYADLQLQYRDNKFRTQHWTFPDYQTETALLFFKNVRQRLLDEEF